MKKIAIGIAAALSVFSAQAASMYAGQELTPGQKISSDDGRYYLTLQVSDGNLVIYRARDNAPVWATYAFGGKRAIMQHDRNFVVYDGVNKPLWSSRTNANLYDTNSYVKVENDGTLSVMTGSHTLWVSAMFGDSCKDGGERRIFTYCSKSIFNGNISYGAVLACDLREAQYRTAHIPGANFFGACF